VHGHIRRCVPLIQLTPAAAKDQHCVCLLPPGVDKYTTAVAALFDPATSRADLISLEVQDPHTLKLRWRLEGKLQLGGCMLVMLVLRLEGLLRVKGEIDAKGQAAI
jgi:hypothetical protein